jgi:hypothetical protein
MKTPLVVLLVIAVLLVLFWVLRPANDPHLLRPRTDLPWQVQAYPDGTSQVFDLHLGRATLADAVAKFGPYEKLAVFASEDGRPALEAYFGTVQFGPLKARVVAALAAAPEELSTMIQASPTRQGSPTGDWKYPVRQADWVKQESRVVRAITYMPTYDGLQGDYFRERFGAPKAWKTLDAHAVQWYYPAQGLSLLLNAEGAEVLEFVPPRAMRLPEDVEYAPPPEAH